MNTFIKSTILLILLTFLSCNKEVLFEPNLPACIRDIVKDQAKQPLAIKSQIIGNDQHYWLNTDAVQFDGIEFIVNNQCDTVCSFCGECIPPTCAGKYKQDDWVTLWKK